MSALEYSYKIMCISIMSILIRLHIRHDILAITHSVCHIIHTEHV